MKIALLQTDIVWENKAANLQRAGELIAGLPAGVRLAVLPEMFNTGFSMHPERIAEDEKGETVAWLSATAKQHNIAIVCSISYVYLKQYFNRLFFVFPDGTYTTYDKRHLFRYGKEPEHYAAGTERLIVEYEGWRICPLVCYDLRFPVWSRNVQWNAEHLNISKSQDLKVSTSPTDLHRYTRDYPSDPRSILAYDLLIYVANWPTPRIHPWNTLLPARAIENQSYVVGLNRTSTDLFLTGEKSFTGESQVIDFKGNIIAKADEYEEEVLVVDLDINALNKFRAHFPVWMDADQMQIQ